MTTDEAGTMFEVGDAVYHPVNGAGVIARLQRMPALRKDQRFYRIRMLNSTKTVLLVPVTKARELGLRPVADRGRVEEVLRVLSSEPVTLPDAHKQRYKVCEEKLDVADTLCTAEVVRDLNWRCVQHDKLNVPGRRIMQRAMKLLSGELAVAQGIALEEAEVQINEALKSRTVAVATVGSS
jgi:CarD family transcriptional regulator